jgi:HAD superfamily hydrolase (TIGR01509 family)
MLRAVLWDVDGTLAETERDGHRVAFNLAFDEMGLPWRWDEAHYGRLLAVTGGVERLLHDMANRPDAPADHEALARELHRRKTRHYADIVRSGAISLRPGVRELFNGCAAAGLRQAIITTTSRQNVEELLAASGLDGFEFMLCADSAPRKKPDPQVVLLALRQLGLPAHEVIAIEDSPAGVAACAAAGVPVVLARSAYFSGAAAAGALAAGPGLHTSEGWAPAAEPGPGIGPGCLMKWLAGRDRDLRGQ